MLNKLIKYEFQSILRIVIPIALVFIAMTGIIFGVYSVSIESNILRIIPGLFNLMYIINIILLMASAFLYTIFRFYKNLITNEGYLMFTLPVKTGMLIQAKLITAIITQAITIVLCILSLAIVGQAKFSPFKFQGFGEQLDEAASMIDVSGPVLIAIMVVFCLFALLQNNLTYYASIALGHTMAKNKIIGSVIGYFIINTCYQIIASIMIFVIYFISGGDISPVAMLLFLSVFFIGGSVGLYKLTNYYLSTKLNLE